MGLPQLAIGAGSALLGALGGGAGKNSNQSSVSGIHVNPLSELGVAAQKGNLSNFNALQGLVNKGPGEEAMTNANSANSGYADMLKQYTSNGGMPSADQIGMAQKFGQMTYGGAFDQQRQQAAQLASQLGRSVNDPIIQAKLATQQANTMGGFVAGQSQQFANQAVGYAGQLAQFQQGLASQAMNNRQAILGLGSQLQNQEQQYQIATGEHYGNVSQSGGGGLGGAISGALAGFGTAAGAMNLLGMGGGGGGGGGGGDGGGGGGGAGGAIGGNVGGNIGSNAAGSLAGQMIFNNPFSSQAFGPQLGITAQPMPNRQLPTVPQSTGFNFNGARP